ncbi:hypothetical protein G5V58_23960 [Nocardioides anomalus]|uniref:Uncharacterized protein n=1 Tax=Nocardioides anomalus TaxID=2712223 RepID=A0A6G6WJL3_9ACTN|nr:hypothetical protein [Nocardioides anomalus]QIG45396.1 hypothetical protein G5V58_23960 [Nocardioides anomalus]
MNDDEGLLRELGEALGHEPGAQPSPERVAAVRAQAARAGRGAGRRRFLLGGGVAASVAGIAGVAGYWLAEREDQPVAAPMEQIVFTGEGDVTASGLVHHAWGTELVLDVGGLRPGTAYDVVFGTTDGDVGAGSLRAVPDVVMRCRFEAAPLRADVHTIELRDPDGRPVLRSDLPSI